MEKEKFKGEVETDEGHIEVDEKGVLFHHEEHEECWEYTWEELYTLTREDFYKGVPGYPKPDKPKGGK